MERINADTINGGADRAKVCTRKGQGSVHFVLVFVHQTGLHVSRFEVVRYVDKRSEVGGGTIPG